MYRKKKQNEETLCMMSKHVLLFKAEQFRIPHDVALNPRKHLSLHYRYMKQVLNSIEAIPVVVPRVLIEINCHSFSLNVKII